MPNYFKITAINILLIFTLFSIAFCEDETITITTYYPSPYGVYKELRLYPTDSPDACDGDSKGAMYYKNADNQIYVCNGTDWTVGGGTPSGAIMMFTSECPAGWTCVSCAIGDPLYQRFPRGEADYDSDGYGSTSHTHTYSGQTLMSAEATKEGFFGSDDASAKTHTHNYVGITDGTEHLPPYIDVIWCKKD